MNITVFIRENKRFFQNVICQNNDGTLYILEDGLTIAVYKKWDYYIVD